MSEEKLSLGELTGEDIEFGYECPDEVYLKVNDSPPYACVTLIASYDYGWGNIEVTEGFVRKAVVTTKYVYE